MLSESFSILYVYKSRPWAIIVYVEEEQLLLLLLVPTKCREIVQRMNMHMEIFRGGFPFEPQGLCQEALH